MYKMKKWREPKIGKGVKRPKSKNMKGLNLQKKHPKTATEPLKNLAKNKSHIKKILVPLDGSKKAARALDEAIIIAKQFEALIICLNVMPVIPLGDSRLVKKIKYQEQIKAKKILQKAEKLCKKNLISYSEVILGGDPGVTILKTASSKKCDLIIMGSGGKGIAKKIFIGSVSNYVLQKSKIPVLIVK